MELIQSGIYRHYKGKLYRVIGIAKHSETLDDMVVYQALYDSEECGNHTLWVRPLPMFLETIESDGQKIPRFEYLRPE